LRLREPKLIVSICATATNELGAQTSTTLGPPFQRRILAPALPESPFDLRFFSTAVKTDASGQIITDLTTGTKRLVGAESAGVRAGLARYTKILFAHS
jgi:hypothetical protein